MSRVSLGRFSLKDEPGMSPCWTPPAGVTALIDLVPPALDAEPDVNFAVMLSDAPLDSNDCHHSFGEGNVTEMQMTGAGRDAWEAVTGYWPRSGTVGNCVAEHLLRSPGQDRANPLTCGKNRGLEVHLGGKIWDHTLTGLSDPLALPVLQIEAEGLAKTYLEHGEQQYRLAMGGLRKKYDTRPVKELIQYLFPSGREDLPLLDELTPQTVKTENWPNTGSTGVITSGQDFSWVVALGSFTVPSAGTARAGVSSRARMDSAFSNSDYLATFIRTSQTYITGPGIVCRLDAAFANYYLATMLSAAFGRLYKSVSSTQTQIATDTIASALNDVLGVGANGSTITAVRNGSAVQSVTDTAVSTGAYCGLYNSGAGNIYDFLQVVFDDLISGGGGGNSFLNLLLTGVG